LDSVVTLNWSKDAQVFYVNSELVHINTTCVSITPLHDLLHCIMHLIGLVNLEDGFLYSSESKAVLLEDCLRLLMDPKVLNINIDQKEKIKLIASNMFYLTSESHYNIPDQLLDIVREVRDNIDKFLPYLPHIQEFIYKEEKLKQEGFAIDVSGKDDSRSSYLDPKFTSMLDKLKEVIDQIIEFIEAYDSNDMILPLVFI
jgi:hypothetical protein